MEIVSIIRNGIWFLLHGMLPVDCDGAADAGCGSWRLRSGREGGIDLCLPFQKDKVRVEGGAVGSLRTYSYLERERECVCV